MMISSNFLLVIHFSVPRWPLVNKLTGLAKSLDIDCIHCNSIDTLDKTLSTIGERRVMFVADEGMIEYIRQLQSRNRKFELEVALFIESRISEVANRIHELTPVRYLFEFDDKDATPGRNIATLLKKVKDQNFLDLNKYLGYGASYCEKSVNSDSSKKAAINEIGRFITNIGDPRFPTPYKEYARRMTEMVDELVLNAIFNANPRMRACDRSQPFNLGPDEDVHLTWAYDGEYFGVSVRDHFGQFTLESIMERVASSSELSTIVTSKSAGLGQKLIFERAHQIVTNVKEGKVTEVIAVVK